MIDPRTTDIIGQRAMIAYRQGVNPANPAKSRVLGRGVVRVVDYQGAFFAFLIEAVGEISRFGVGNGGLFQVTTFDETVEISVEPPVIHPQVEPIEVPGQVCNARSGSAVNVDAGRRAIESASKEESSVREVADQLRCALQEAVGVAHRLDERQHFIGRIKGWSDLAQRAEGLLCVPR